MISVIFFVNQKGDIIISRFFRDDISRQTVDAFRHEVVAAKKVGVPVVHIDGSSFLYARQGDLFMVVGTKKNINPAMVFQYLYKMVEVFKVYFGGDVNEQSVREHFTLIYELLDETMDNGYPQLTAVNLLKDFIIAGKVKGSVGKKSQQHAQQITSQITGSVDWRTPGRYKYRKNEVFIDVLEAVNLLMSNKGAVLRADVSGKIMMKTYLSGMPECKFGMNDKLVMEREAKSSAKAHRRRPGSGIAIDDVTFHRCVRLGQFDQDRTISFIPPDGEFELMRYRITQHVNQPFRVIPIVNEAGRTHVSYEIKVKGNFSSKLAATNVILKIPTPKNVSKCKMHVKSGKAKYIPEQSVMLWKIRRFAGDASFEFRADVKMIASMQDKAWSRPPIEMEFQVPMFTSSGLHVRFLKVFERSNYQTVKWVRYITRAGQYTIRI